MASQEFWRMTGIGNWKRRETSGRIADSVPLDR
jgi:hypothetical protein